jgi:peptidoglycan/LPS O-acetylase OafA/YrhL
MAKFQSGSAGFQTFASRPQALHSFPLFDWLRFVLASIVVLGHGGFQALPFLTGGLAVKVFFALSGWLIGAILLNTETKDLPRFFYNRATRIWLPYFAAIVLLYGLAVFKEGIDFFWFKYLFLDVTFTHQLYTFFPVAHFEMPMDGSGNQFWSLSVEEQFYLFAPLLMLFVPGGKSLRVWLPIALTTVALGWNAGSVSVGVCAAILQRDMNIANRPAVRVLALGVAVASAVAMSILSDEYVFGPAFAIATVVALAIPGKRTALSHFVGGISFPLYLNHWIAAFAINFVEKRWYDFTTSVSLVIYYIIAIAVATMLYWAIDRTVKNHRDQWYRPELGRNLGIIAYALVFTGIIGGGLIHLYGPHGIVPDGYQEITE